MRYLPFGDSALLIELGNTIDAETNRKVISLDNEIVKAKMEGVNELVPTYRSLLIRYDSMKIGCEELISKVGILEKALKEPTTESKGKKVTIPVVYGEEYGPDLTFIAQYHKLTEQQVVTLHTAKEYRVFMIGFVAGFPYLGEVAKEIATPRLETPRLKVPAGSVGIAEGQTGIYPCEAPGGWRIIGRTPVKLFDHSLQPPALLRPGDTVRFRSISEAEFRTLLGRNMNS